MSCPRLDRSHSFGSDVIGEFQLDVYVYQAIDRLFGGTNQFRAVGLPYMYIS